MWKRSLLMFVLFSSISGKKCSVNLYFRKFKFIFKFTGNYSWNSDNTDPQLTCVACSSVFEGDDCIFKPNETKQCDSPDGLCYVRIGKDGGIDRGCIGKSLNDCFKAPENCSICSNENLCNGKPIQKEICDTKSIDAGLMYPSECRITVRPMGCYVHINETRLINRMSKGCVANLTAEYRELCQKNGTTCKICFGERCNNGFDNYLPECVECGFFDSNCLAPDVTITTKSCSGLNDKCYTYLENNRIHRGCSNDKFVHECKPNDPNCEQCSSNQFCNSKAIRNTCIQCNSRNNSKCVSEPDTLNKRICSVQHPLHSKQNGCFMRKLNDGSIERGCIIDLPEAERIDCFASKGDCQYCLGTNCNKKPNFQQTCYTCNGTVDKQCTEFNENMKIILCANYSSSCMIGVDLYGRTYRGCSGQNDRRFYGKGFDSCFNEKCNTAIFPFNRRYCYQCSGGAGCEFSLLSKPALKPCNSHQHNNNDCYTLFDEGDI